MHKLRIKNAQNEETGNLVIVNGWVRSSRFQKNIGFIDLYDGSNLKGIQIIIEGEYNGPTINTGSSIEVQGHISENPNKPGLKEIISTDIKIVGDSPENYPIQKKRHTLEYLRTIQHLRPRTKLFGSIARIRHHLTISTHQYFDHEGYIHLHAPIITSNDCEGAGETFSISSKVKDNFFGNEAHLSVSGQLYAEIYAQALYRTYTFGPTFRAENTNTSRHLSEFWMIEPELAFISLKELLQEIESYIKYVIKSTLDNCYEDLSLFNQFVSKGLINRLENVLKHDFKIIEYSDAIKLLTQHQSKFENHIVWGDDLNSEHEKFICEYTEIPTFIVNYPKGIKAFYMKMNDDNKTVAAVDLLVPGIGELVGGSLREESVAHLKDRMSSYNISEEQMWWYIELRRYGSTPHGGFGVGFERLIKYVTGMDNIRDVIPFPRYVGHATF